METKPRSQEKAVSTLKGTVKEQYFVKASSETEGVGGLVLKNIAENGTSTEQKG